MKNLVIFTVILVSMSLFISCSKNENKIDNDDNVNLPKNAVAQIIEYYQDQNTYDGEIFMIHDFLQTKYTNSTHFSFQGKMPENTNYSSISFNNYSINIQDNSFYASSSIDSINLSNHLQDFFGTANTIQINGLPLISDFYVPFQVTVDFSNDEDFTFVKSNGISFDLDVDENNQNEIVVILFYDDDDVQQGGTYLTKMYVLNSQTRSFTIPSQDLSLFPTNQNDITLYVGCGTREIVQFDGKSFDIEGINITSIPGLTLL
ncbi:MAG: hypothetical protein JXR34_12110 [Bacteroidales bacterium]|nr:hypothetical protein [Bacteroidales bacterium]